MRVVWRTGRASASCARDTCASVRIAFRRLGISKRGLLGRMKYTAAEIDTTNAYSRRLVWNVVQQMSFLRLPDRRYLGFRHVANKNSGLVLDVGANDGISAAGFRRINLKSATA